MRKSELIRQQRPFKLGHPNSLGIRPIELLAPKRPDTAPRYLERRMVGDVIFYYWRPPTWARKQSCPMRCVPLGSNYAQASRQVRNELLPVFDRWREGVRKRKPKTPPFVRKA